MSTTNGKSDDMELIYLGMLGLLAGAIWIVWAVGHAEIAYYGLKFAWYQLGVLDWPFMPNAIRRLRTELAMQAVAPGRVSFASFLAEMNQAGYLFVWIPVLLTIRGVKIAVTHKANLTRRKVTVQTLPWIISRHSPAIIPSLYYGDKDTLLLNVDPVEHRSSINPEVWVSQHGLLIDGVLDRERCRELLIADLRERVASLDALEPQEKALFVVLAKRVFPTKEDLANTKDGDAAQKLLDELNRSCHKHTWQGKKGYPDLSLAVKAFDRYASQPEAKQWLAKHPYPRTLLHAMHKVAQTTGKLPSSQFRWLKGMDRGLWYALNTTGRKAPFLESAAVFTQTLWEEFAFDTGYRLEAPYVDDAIDGVENYLIKIGLMSPAKKKEQQ
ncbi:TrbA-like protein [Burkholderia diffusa]|uniref:secretion/conjugation apparatus DotM-related subunit n=1 Tax=Burkholderia diffusa TaxID=488732 RepID=UPI001CB5EAEA|nr:conjugal transfer protein TrbA [Burkholderia diffusa]CAG9260951.1 TrbA-like protein [Burkholderia diffusa]